MRLRRSTLPFAVLALLTFATAAWPLGNAQSDESTWKEADGDGDAWLQAGPNGEIGQAALVPWQRGASDIRSLEIFGETGSDVVLRVGFETLYAPRENKPVRVTICLVFNEQPLGVYVDFTSGGQLPQPSQPRVGSAFVFPHTPCSFVPDVGAVQAKPQATGIASHLAVSAKAVEVLLPKEALATLGATSFAPGSSLSSLEAFAALEERPSAAGRSGKVWVIDRVPDAGPSDTEFTFQLPLANSGDLRVELADEAERASGSCSSGRGFPLVAARAGDATAVPVRIQNHGKAPLSVGLAASITAAGWEVSIISSRDLPAAASDSSPGNGSAMLMVRAPETAGLLCATATVAAVDPKGGPPGELNVDLVATPILSVTNPVLFLHSRPARADAELDADRTLTMNTVEHNPEMDRRLQFRPYGQPQVGSISSFRVAFITDSVFPFDTYLDSNGSAMASIFLESEPLATNARLTFDLTQSSGPLASGTAEVQIPVGGALLQVPMPVFPDAWRAPTRTALAGTPYRLLLSYQPLNAHPDVPTPPGVGAGDVFLRAERSSLALPVVSLKWVTEFREGTGGELVIVRFEKSEKQLENQQVFINPGRTRTFNVTVSNEGSKAMDVLLDMNVTSVPQASWKAVLAGGSGLDGLAGGESRTLRVFLTAPPDADDGATARLIVAVRDRNGPATSTDSVGVLVVASGAHGAELAPPPGSTSTPGPEFVWVLITIVVGTGIRGAWKRRGGGLGGL